MSILIKGMEMPENCTLCPIITWYDGDGDYVCPFSGISALNIGRQDDCPLIEVPPHGRLIDADELYSRFMGMANEEWNQKCGGSWSDGFMESASIVEDAPTVIPSDKDGET